MSNNLISGLYRRIKETKLEEKRNSSNNNLKRIIVGLVSFVERNPDLTSEDIKILAKTDEEKNKILSTLFDRFPNIVEEIKKNGDKNLLALIEDKSIEEIHYGNLASKLDKYIKKACPNKKKLTISIRNQYLYKYNTLAFIQAGKKTMLYKDFADVNGSAGAVRRSTNLSISEVAQILGMVNFCMTEKITESNLRKIVNDNQVHDFSAIETILNSTKSVNEELAQGDYGAIKLIELYEGLLANKQKEIK